MKVRDLIKELVEFEAGAEIAVDTSFSSVLGEEEGLEVAEVRRDDVAGTVYATIIVDKT